MSSELKACPFCGGIAWDGASSMRVYCQECYAQVKQEISEGHDVVVARWNRRTPSPAVRALVEACRKIVPYIESPAWHDKMIDDREVFDEALAAVEREIGGK